MNCHSELDCDFITYPTITIHLQFHCKSSQPTRKPTNYSQSSKQ